MTWSEHIDTIIARLNQRLGIIKRIKHLLPLQARLTLFNSIILPLLDYGDIIWGDKNNESLMKHLQVQQNKAAKIILDLPPRSSSTEALSALRMINLTSRRRLHRCTTIFKCIHKLIDFDFNLRYNNSFHLYNTRRKNDLHLPQPTTNWGKQKFKFHALTDWNNLDFVIRETLSLPSFKARLKQTLK